MSEMRIGLGYDVHAFAEGRPLVLGGVTIPHPQGLLGHSDADVLTHAVMDAVLGAMRAGDIGKHFPDSDPVFSGISSIELLKRVAALVASSGYAVIDVDSVLVAEVPKISPYREEMRRNISSALGIDTSRVGVKATTTEGLGFEGRSEGIAAQAVALLEHVAARESEARGA